MAENITNTINDESNTRWEQISTHTDNLSTFAKESTDDKTAKIIEEMENRKKDDHESDEGVEEGQQKETGEGEVVSEQTSEEKISGVAESDEINNINDVELETPDSTVQTDSDSLGLSGITEDGFGMSDELEAPEPPPPPPPQIEY